MTKKFKIHTSNGVRHYKFEMNSSKINVYYDDGSWIGNWVEIGSSKSEQDCLKIAENHASSFGNVKKIEF